MKDKQTCIFIYAHA